jgi:AmmeMemoRadiSam system protein B
MTSIREPVVAGTFYPGSASTLEDTLTRLFGEPVPASEAALGSPVGLIVPHAGYPYSGPTAAVGYRWLATLGRPAWALILGANHTGMGRPISLAQEGTWRTPLGEVPIAAELAGRLVEAGLEISENAFLREHSIEVQLPFVQFLYGEGLPFVPICVMTLSLPELMGAGEAIADVIRDDPGVVIISSDFTHYEPHEVAQQLDHKAIEQILCLDVEGFYQRLVGERLSICGGGAIVVLMSIAQTLGWNQPRLLSYATSGDVSGDHSAVVGYAAVSFAGGEHG